MHSFAGSGRGRKLPSVKLIQELPEVESVRIDSEEQKSQVKTNVMLVVFGSGKMEAV